VGWGGVGWDGVGWGWVGWGGMVWGVWGDAEKSYESVSVKFELFGHKKSKENHQNHFFSFSHF